MKAVSLPLKARIWDDKPIDVSSEVNFIWSVATLLHSVSYKDADHRDVILPMTVLRRLECALAPTKEKVVKYAAEHPNAPEAVLKNRAGMEFFNKSPWTLEKLLSVKSQVRDLKEYIAGFSSNVAEIFKRLEFDSQIEKMESKNVLFGVIKKFTEIDLSPATVDSVKMGYIFEDLMRKFYESAEAGKQYTGRDIIRLMVEVLLSEGSKDVFDSAAVVTILDQACGTGGMLSTSFDYIRHRNPEAKVFLYGQEFDDAAYAICLAEMLIKGQSPDNIRFADSLMTDCFPDRKMHFVIENPPFGTAWGGNELEKRERAVKAENTKDGRYPAGLPGTGDSQLLFVQSAIDKMDERCGRAAIIEHAGPLYTGDAGSGESEIRRWILKNDLLEAIIALPVDLFYNTGLQTFIWILSKNKSARRKGKVQLIDASSFCTPRRKPIGEKKNEISPKNREAVTKLYADFKENEFVKICDNEDFIYREYTVMRPKYGEDGKPERDRRGEIVYDKDTKDKEIVPFKEDIDAYMAHEVLPHMPDAKAFFMEDLSKKKPVVKTGAKFPFTRYFYRYVAIEPSERIWQDVVTLDKEIEGLMSKLGETFGTFSTLTKGIPGKHRRFRSSGIPWIGEIPVNWETRKIASLYIPRTTKVSDQEYPPLSVTMQGILPQLEHVAKSNDRDNRKLVRKNDFVINSRSDRRGACGIAKQDGSVSLINIVLQPLDEMVPEYFDWLFHTPAFADEFYKWGQGIDDDVWSTHWTAMKKIEVPFPPIDEQLEIAKYLSLIDSIIVKRREQLERLEAFRRSMIQEYTTGKKEVK